MKKTLLNKLIYSFLAWLCFAGVVHSQISFGGKPLSFTSSIASNCELDRVEMPVKEVAAEAMGAPKVGGLRFAHPFFVDYTTQNSGSWVDAPDGKKVWRLKIRSAGAYSLNLIFDHFKMPASGKMFIYSPDSTIVIGALTHMSHSGDEPFGTIPVAGDELIVEYSQDASESEMPNISINAVNHDYKNAFGNSVLKAGEFGDSDDCNVDVTCVADKPDTRNGVVKLIVDGTELCTGSLINNVRKDGSPYIITANHCLNQLFKSHSFVAWFNYQVPDCNRYIEGVRTQTISGAQIKAQAADLDLLLIRLNQMPPASYQPYWVGWNIGSSIPSAPEYCYHHPQSDVKKYSLSYSPLKEVSFLTSRFIANSHWEVNRWDMGATQGGSSGCGLFDANNHLVGTLSGGYATCENPLRDYFSRINKSWSYYSDASSQLKAWLDPDGTGTQRLDGFNYYGDKECVRLSNYQKGDSAIYIDNGTKWCSRNSEGVDAVAELFGRIESANVKGIYLIPNITSTAGQCRVRLWSGYLFSQGSDAVFDTVVNVSNLHSNAENLIDFNHPVAVIDPVSVSVELPSGISLYYQTKASGRKGNSAYLRKSGLWYAFPDVHPLNDSTSVYIDLLLTDAVLRTDTTNRTEVDGRVVVYHHPKSSIVQYDWGMDYLKTLDVYDLTGRKVVSKTYSPAVAYGHDKVDLNSQTAGVYLFYFRFAGFAKCVKVMVY